MHLLRKHCLIAKMGAVFNSVMWTRFAQTKQFFLISCCCCCIPQILLILLSRSLLVYDCNHWLGCARSRKNFRELQEKTNWPSNKPQSPVSTAVTGDKKREVVYRLKLTSPSRTERYSHQRLQSLKKIHVPLHNLESSLIVYKSVAVCTLSTVFTPPHGAHLYWNPNWTPPYTCLNTHTQFRQHLKSLLCCTVDTTLAKTEGTPC